MPTYAETVATVALLLSVASLGWQVYLAQMDLPNVEISGQWMVGWDQNSKTGEMVDQASWHLPVTLVNTGKRAVTIEEVFWQLDLPAGYVNIKGSLKGPQLPYRLEAFDRASWEHTIPVRGTMWNERYARPGASVVLTAQQRRRLLKRDETGYFAGHWAQLRVPPEVELNHAAR